MERSLDISSRELIQFNDQLKKEKEMLSEKLKSARKNFMKNKQNYKPQLTAYNVGFIMTDTNNTIVMINSAAKHILILQSSDYAISKKYLPDFNITLEEVENS